MIRRTICLAISVLFLTPTFYAQQSSSGISLVLSERPYGDRVAAMAMDRAGSVWAVGTGPAGLPTSADAFKATSPGQGAILQRIAPDGSVSYLTYLGTFNATAIALDATDNIYVTGSVQRPQDFSATPGAFDQECGGTCQSDDAVVMKLAAGGRSLVYATFLGGADFDNGQGIAVDAAGRAYVVGKTSSVDFPLTPGAVRTTLTGVRTQDAFYARFSADGSRLEYSTYLGGSDIDDGAAIAVDGAGRAYVAGRTESPDFIVKNANNSTAGGPNGFLARFGATGLDFSTLIGGADSDLALAIALSPTGVYVSGESNSSDLSGVPRNCESFCTFAAFVTRLTFDGALAGPTVFLDGSLEESAASIAVDANDVVYVTGRTKSRDFPVTQDAAQITLSGFADDAFLAVIPMTGASAGRPAYVTYLGGTWDEWSAAALADRSGGAWIGGFGGSPDFPRVNAKQEGGGQAWIAHFAQTGVAPPVSSDIVLYARDASSIAGTWQLAADSTAAGNTRIWNPDGGVPKLPASAAPASFFELTFHAEAGVSYHVWLRMKADGDSWTNDSVHVQFSDSVDDFGNPAWRIGTTSAAIVSLEDCTGCGEHGWGWNDNGYDRPGDPVTFSTTGTHTIRIQQREDGISIDQVVLSTRTYINAAPGAGKDDATILPPSDGTPAPSDPKEIVMHVASEKLPGGAGWLVTPDDTAADRAGLFNPNQGAPKVASPVAAYPDYFEVRFTAEAGVPYHLWVRAKAEDDYYGNDSVFLQFSDSVDSNGSANFRIGTNSSTNVILEDCSGCPEQGWGWTDNAYDAFAAPIYFATSGPQTIRVIRREDGMSIDQIVLSAAKYFSVAPGPPRNDTTIVPK